MLAGFPCFQLLESTDRQKRPSKRKPGSCQYDTGIGFQAWCDLGTKVSYSYPRHSKNHGKKWLGYLKTRCLIPKNIQKSVFKGGFVGYRKPQILGEETFLILFAEWWQKTAIQILWRFGLSELCLLIAIGEV